MAAEPTTITTQAPEAQADPSAPIGTQATPAPAGETNAEIQARLDKVLAHKVELEKDLAKIRQRDAERQKEKDAEKSAFEAKLKEQGDHLKLYDLEKEKRETAERLVADLQPKAERLTAHEARVIAKLEAAKAVGDLPSHIANAIDRLSKIDPDEAFDFLTAHRATTAVPQGKQPAPPAPAQGAAPSTPAAKKRAEDMTPAEIINLKSTDPAAHAAAFGGAAQNQGSIVSRWLGG